jgi:S1-C subfamily serine protease
MDGQGTYTYANGRKEVGEFKNDALNGYAIKYFANGSIDQEGIFKDDEFLYAQETSPNIIIKDNQDDKVINASSGSGFAVSSDGYVITNNHVIEGCQEVIVHTKEKDIKTRIISFDPQNDLALLKGDFQPKTVFALSNNRPELLQDIYVAGYPFGNAISSSIKVTKGIISSLTGIGNNFSNIQIDAALQSGNSGGPIIDDNGNVIAVAVSKLDAKYMLENFGSIPENTNFGIKSSVVKSILDSNDVARPDANQSEISKTMLGKMISSGTYYISCWMTQAQIELLKSKKVLFEGLN